MLDLAVGVLPRLPGREVVNEDASRGEILQVVLRELALQVGDGLAVGRPARLARVVGDLDPVAAVAVHDVHVPHPVRSLSLIGDEGDPGPIGRGLGIELVNVPASASG